MLKGYCEVKEDTEIEHCTWYLMNTHVNISNYHSCTIYKFND